MQQRVTASLKLRKMFDQQLLYRPRYFLIQFGSAAPVVAASEKASWIYSALLE
jgi:hypothetical protein